ncbi:MAG: hypothetical protein JXR37_29645 [Kiritimatiellae bacterium]|nr:hypothetical protein [Kiritimatiellia bacterium]
MSRFVMLVFVCVLVLVLGGGCASLGYMGDRARDAADVFMVHVGEGIGVSVQAGPLKGDVFGETERPILELGKAQSDAARLKILKEDKGIDRDDPRVEERLKRMVESRTPNDILAVDLVHFTWRHGRADNLTCGASCTMFSNTDAYRDGTGYFEIGAKARIRPASQITAKIGLWLCLGLGFNLGEFADFLLGWTTVDVARDDLMRMKRE